MIGNKIMTEVKNAEIKTTTIRDKNEENNKKSFNSESRSQNTVKQKKKHKKNESRARLLLYRKSRQH
jgi:hypothetical protein